MKNLKENSGITLVALVVTIIVLIILATVSINATLGENGIIKKAELAQKVYANAVTKEEEDMNRLLEEYNNMMTEPEISYWTYDQASQTVTNGKITLNIGDYIDYNCNAGITEASYTSESAKNGYGEQTFNVADYTKGWRVFGANDDGELLLISEDIVPLTGGYTDESTERTYYYLQGQEGYVNGISELNNICSIYGKGTGATGARNATIEDINKITGYDPEIARCDEGNIGEYGNEVTYTLQYHSAAGAYAIFYKGTKYPTSLQSEGTIRTFIYYSNNEWKELGQDESITLKSTSYSYYPNTLTNSSDGDTVGVSETSLAYKMLCTDSITTSGTISNYYWLSSSYIHTYLSARAGYGLYYIDSGAIQGGGYGNNFNYLSISVGSGGNSYYNGVRPIVSLSNSVQITDSGTQKNSCTLWKMN